MDGERLLNSREAAALLGYTPAFIRQMVRDGRLPVAGRVPRRKVGPGRQTADGYRRADVLAAPDRTPRVAPCRHCGREAANRPRGLGFRCYYTPGVLAMYPPRSVHARRGVGLGAAARPLPAGPTAALPGTPEKVAVLAARAAAGVGLWHPLDRTGAEDARAAGWGVRKAVRA